MLEENSFANFEKKPRLNVLPQNPEGEDLEKAVGLGRFPSWLHRKLVPGNKLWETEKAIRKQMLHTVCEEAKCPNLLECWSKKTATFLIMGKGVQETVAFAILPLQKPLSP